MATPVTAMTTASTAPPLPRPSSNRSESYRRLSFAIAIKTMGNLAFVAVSAVSLISTVNEKPDTPLRVWISVYSLGCLLRVQLLWLVYKKRNDTGVSQSSGIAISTLIRSARILEKLNAELSNMLLGTGSIWLGFVGNDAPRLYRKVHQSPTSATFPNTYLKRPIMRSKVEHVEWSLCRQMLQASLLNMFF